MTKRFLISGLVQGVGFRAYVHRLAIAVGATGEVWNRTDGKVEALMTHDNEQIFELIESQFERGPGHVDSISVFDEPPLWSSRFEIGPTR